jgi:hypothetical protein
VDDRFLYEGRRDPRPEFAGALRERLNRQGPAQRAFEAARPLFRLRPALAWAALAIVLSSFAFPSVRASAQAFLDLFRVRNFTAVEFDPARMEKLRELHTSLGDDPALLVFDRTEVVKDPGKPEPYPTPAAAGAAAGLDVRVPDQLPAGLALEKVEMKWEGEARLSVKTERLRSVLDALQIRDVHVPPGLDGQVLTVRLAPMVALHYEKDDRRVHFLQARSPEVTLPQGTDLAQLGEIGLRVLGLEPAEAQRLARSIDWRSTLLVPVPASAGVFRQVDVRGNKGLLVTVMAGPKRREGSMLMWSEGDRVYAMAGNIQQLDLLQMANSVR